MGQINDKSDIFRIAEELAESDSDPEEVSAFVERLEELAEAPVRINTGDEKEISRLFFLSEYQVYNLVSSFKSTGNIVSVYEIASIAGFDRGVVEMMIPFISLDQATVSPLESTRIHSTFLTNIIFKPGEADTSSEGSPLKILSKYRITAGRFSGGFTIEKDQGEKLFCGDTRLPDFYSGYISYSGEGIIKQFVAGDFALRFGQGLSVSSGMRTRIPVTSAGYLRGRDEVRPYTSTDENNFFRGAAATFSTGILSASLFASRNKVDANIKASSDSSEFFTESLYSTGLHIDSTTMLKKDRLEVSSFGADISFNLRPVKFGFVFYEDLFSVPFIRDPSDPESLYDFTGKKNLIWSAYYNTQFRKLLLFGEAASNDLRNIAITQGMMIRPSDRLVINVLVRDYPPGFISFHGRGPGYSDRSANEKGILANFTFEAAKHLFIMAGCDLCRSPWLKYRTSSPSSSKRYELRINYVPDENLTFDFAYNCRLSTTDDQADSGIPSLVDNISHLMKGSVRYSLSENLVLTTRAGLKFYNPGSSGGSLLIQDLNYRFRKIPLTLWYRFSVYNTDDWNSRLYAYENDLLYSFSIPALSGKGTRSYLMLKWDLGHFAEIRMKYALTSVLDHGYDKRETDELKFQVRIWL